MFCDSVSPDFKELSSPPLFSVASFLPSLVSTDWSRCAATGSSCSDGKSLPERLIEAREEGCLGGARRVGGEYVLESRLVTTGALTGFFRMISSLAIADSSFASSLLFLSSDSSLWDSSFAAASASLLSSSFSVGLSSPAALSFS